jgi:hypothetical protein
MPRTELNEVFQNVYDPISASLRTSDGGQSFQKLFDYDVRTDDNPVYIGYGVRGLATSSDGWLINKITYDDSDRPISIKSAIGVYNNRASLTYN